MANYEEAGGSPTATSENDVAVLAYRADTTESSPASAGRGRAESMDPRHLFLDAKAVMQRYGWGKTKGIRT